VGDDEVSALWLSPAQPKCAFILAHGAGAGMRHPFLEAVAQGLLAQQIATLRYQFAYMEKGSRRPDPPARCHAVVRAAVAAVARLTRAPLFAGGRSFGGRMSSQAAAAGLLPEIKGLIFLGFPLHPAGKPSTERAAHLLEVRAPMLFLQGTRDDLAELSLLQTVAAQLGSRATLKLFNDADHSFHVPKSSGTNDNTIRLELIDSLAHWLERHANSL